MSDEETTSEEVRSFADEAISVLAGQRHGTMLYDLGMAIAEAVQATRTTGKPSAITVKLGIRPAQKGGGSALNLSDEIKVTKPKPETGETLMYATEDGRLSRRHPDQPFLPEFSEERKGN